MTRTFSISRINAFGLLCLLVLSLAGAAGAQTVVPETTVRLNQREVVVSGPVTAGPNYLTISAKTRVQSNGDHYETGIYTNGAGQGWSTAFQGIAGGTGTVYNSVQLPASAIADGDTLSITLDATGSNPTTVTTTITDTTKGTTLATYSKSDSSPTLQAASASAHATAYALVSATAYDLTQAGTTFAVNAAGVAGGFTPNVWYIGAMAGGNYEAVCAPRGGEGDWVFTGSSVKVGVDVGYFSSVPAANYPVVACTVDGGAQQVTQIAPNMTSFPLVVSGSGSHTLHLTYIEVGATVPTLGATCRWTSANTNKTDGPTATLRLTGFTVDSGATVAAATGLPSQYFVLLGDSISEDDFSNTGLLALGLTLSGDTRTDYAYNIGNTFGLQEIRIAYAGEGVLLTSPDGVPGADAALNNYDDTHPRSWTVIGPNVRMFLINHGTNDQGYTDAQVQAADQALYQDCLSKFPVAQGYILVPFGGFKSSAITAAVSAVNSSRLHLINLSSAASAGLTGGSGSSYQSVDRIHPNTATHANLSQMVIKAVQQSNVPLKRRIN